MTETLRTIGRYDLLRPIGIGGMAVVYLARQTDLDRLVAVKELRDFRDADPGLADRFIRESRVSGRLAHQNIVTVHDYCQHDGIPYIVMEYLRAGSLRPLVSSLTTPQIAGVLEGMLSALAYAEREGVVHRDLKPENVMVTEDGRVKLADFGIAKQVASSTTRFRTRTGQAIGTPTYMSPEQALADTDAIGPRSDLYGIGVMAYEMLLGRPPFEADNPVRVIWRHVNDPIPPPLDVRPDLNPAIAAWLERMLEKAPDDRPPGADAAWRQLEDALAHELDWTWRRQARLLPASPEAETPRPLTPAPFSEALPAEPAPREDSFATFVPRRFAKDSAPGAAPAPPAVEPAAAASPPPAAPAAEPAAAAPPPPAAPPAADELATVFPPPAPPPSQPTPAPPAPPRATPAPPDVVEDLPAEPSGPVTLAPTRPPDQPEPRRTRVVLMAAAIVLAAGALGFLLGGDEAATSTTVTAAGLEARIPSTWQPAASPPAVPDIVLSDAEGFELGEAAIVLGRATSLPPGRAVTVALGAVQAYRYAGGAIYAVPTARDVRVLACPGAADDCGAIAATLEVTEGRALPVGPSAAHARAITRIMRRLEGDRGGLAANSASRQAAAAEALEGDLITASAAVDRLRPGPVDRQATGALGTALGLAAQAYRELANRARANDAAGHRAAAAVAENRERRIKAALTGFEAAGYRVRP